MDDAQDEVLNYLANACQMAKDSGLVQELDQAMPPKFSDERLAPSQLLERVLEYDGRIRTPQLTWVSLSQIELNHGTPLIELRKMSVTDIRDLFIELLIERLQELKDKDPAFLWQHMNIRHQPTGEKPEEALEAKSKAQWVSLNQSP